MEYNDNITWHEFKVAILEAWLINNLIVAQHALFSYLLYVKQVADVKKGPSVLGTFL